MVLFGDVTYTDYKSFKGKSNMKESVVLVHGLWMSGYACLYWQRSVRQTGMDSVVYSYPTVFNRMDQNAERLFRAIKRSAKSTDKVHLVGHSMGGMVILHMLRRHGHAFGQNGLPSLGRVVLCGSPINGSHAARTVRSWPVFGRVLGNSILDWSGISRTQLPEHLDIGVIAGTRNLGFGRMVKSLPQPSDGTVSLVETELKGGETDRVCMKISHAEMLVAPAVGTQIVHFLQNGRFLHRADGFFSERVPQ